MRFGDIGLGIELVDATGNAGATPNEPGDGDTGANLLQNSPVIVGATEEDSLLSIFYSVDAGTLPLRVEFFVADADSTEGAAFIGSDGYANAGSAVAILSADPVEIGERILATAIDANGNTSEFSPSLPVVFLERLFRSGFE